MLTQLISSDPRILIGRATYATTPPLLRPHHARNQIVIGKYCSFGQEVTVFAGGNHPMQALTMHPIGLWFERTGFEEWSADCGDETAVTTIGNDVWLGHQCLILSGSTVGDGVAIGARAVVKGRIPPYAVVAGNPARILRYRFPAAAIHLLSSLKWWDWPEEHICNALPQLRNNDVAALAKYAEENGFLK